MDTNLNKFIVFILFYLAIAFPIGFFTEEVFPFSAFPMYAKNSLTPCGFLAFDKRERVLRVIRGTNHLFLHYGWQIGNSDPSDACQTIRKEFLQKKNAGKDFSVKKYCSDLTKPPPVTFEESTILTCSSKP